MRNQSLLASSLLALVACGDNLTPPTEDTVDPVGRTLTGSQLVQFRELDRTKLDEYPIDLWATVVEAHVPDDEGWLVRPGTGHRDGSFEIEGLPDGHVWLRVARRPYGETFYWTDADHVSFDESILGPEFPSSGVDGDKLQLTIDDLAPWEETDELAWFVPEDLVFDTNILSLRPPAPKTVDLEGAIDWTGRALAELGPDEPAFVVQYRTQTTGDGVDIRAPLRAARPRVDQQAGLDGALAATMTTPPILPYRLAWARDAFEAQRTAVHPTRAGASIGHGFSLFALPGLVGPEMWMASEYPVATLIDPSLLDGTTPLDLGELAIPNPFPRAWLADLYVVTFPVEFPLPDGTPMTLEAVVGRRSTELTTAGPVTPVVTAIREPQIAHRDAFTPLTAVGMMPELSWKAPAVGAPTSYRLQIIEAVVAPPEPYRPGWYVAAELIVPGDVTSVRVPADVLRKGSTYGIVVRTFAQPGQDVTTRPFLAHGSAAFADTILGPFTP